MDIHSGTTDDIENIVTLYRKYRGADWNSIRLAQALENYPSVVAYEDGQLVGFSYTFRFAPDLLELANIYVSPEHRNNRVGTHILQQLEQDCTMEGIKGLITCNSLLYDTAEEKKAPDSFYTRNGFNIAVTTRNTKVFTKIF